MAGFTMNFLTTKALKNNIALLEMTAKRLTEQEIYYPVRPIYRRIICMKTILRIKEAEAIKLPLPNDLQQKILRMAIMKELKTKKIKKYSYEPTVDENRSLLYLTRKINIMKNTNWNIYKWGDMSNQHTTKENLQKYLEMNNVAYLKKDTKKDLMNKIIKI